MENFYNSHSCYFVSEHQQKRYQDMAKRLKADKIVIDGSREALHQSLITGGPVIISGAAISLHSKK